MNDTKIPEATSTERQLSNKQARDLLVTDLKKLEKARGKAVAGFTLNSRQEPNEKFSNNMMSTKKLLIPPYDPNKLSMIIESSSILPQCIEAMVRNCDGFGYELLYEGDGDPEKDTQAKKDKVRLDQFFGQVNEVESFRSIRESTRRDIESYGFGFMEAIRDRSNALTLLYYMDARNVRMQALQKEPVDVEIKLPRDGKVTTVKVQKRFRRYVQLVGKGKIKYFKQYGDPRAMDALTGSYDKVDTEASELIHFKIGNDTYGVPRWSGQALTALGMHSADFVNWDLFENQVVPPLAIMVSGGILTNESINDIRRILVQKRGVGNFNKVLILEAQTDGSITDKSGSKIELKEMSQARKEDGMFSTYIDKGEGRVRSSFRLPPMYTGRAENYSKSTADSAKMVAEEQIFIPVRGEFDEIVNALIVRGEFEITTWAYHSIGPQLITGSEVSDAFKAFSDVGIFSINDGIRLANRLLRLDITPYSQKWGNYPVTIVIELAKLGMLNEIDDITNATGDLTTLISGSNSDDPAKSAKLYVALNQLRNTLVGIAQEQENDAHEVEEQLN